MIESLQFNNIFTIDRTCETIFICHLFSTPLPQFDLSLMGVTRLDMKNQEIRVDEMVNICKGLRLGLV